jgi:ribulose kinase
MHTSILNLAQNWTRYLNTTAHQVRYILNLNHDVAIKQDIDKLLASGFIQLLEATWISPIVVVPKKNGILNFCVDFFKVE